MNARPSIQFGTELALVMDWIRYDALNDEYLLQHNNLQMMSLEKTGRETSGLPRKVLESGR